jgi:DNA-binding MarR family transcriptional regulator
MAKQQTTRREASRGKSTRDERRAPAKRADAAPPELDRVIHERLRLGILSALAVNDSLTFNELKKLLKTTDGNLSVHARKLEDADYISCEKSFVGRTPKTEFCMTAAGKRAFSKYLDEMEALIRSTRRG